MSIQAITRSRHGGLRWRRYEGYGFAARHAVATLAAAEVTHAALALPLTFIRQGDHWALAALLGLVPEQNFYVDAQGHWLANYIPATFRGFPFVIGSQANGEPTLCFDEASGLLTDGSDGEPFFAEEGVLSAGVQNAWSFLQQTAQSEGLLMQACDELAAAEVIEPWPITVQTDQGTKQAAGLHRISEAALNQLADARFAALRRGGFLTVAYAQLLSMGNLARLGQLAQARAQAEAAERARAEVKPMINLPEDSTIDWDWSKIGRE